MTLWLKGTRSQRQDRRDRSLCCSSLIKDWSRSIGELLGYCDVHCEKGHCVDGNVWYAERYLYPNHWQPGSKAKPKLIDDGWSESWMGLWVASLLQWLGALLGVALVLLLFL